MESAERMKNAEAGGGEIGSRLFYCLPPLRKNIVHVVSQDYFVFNRKMCYDRKPSVRLFIRGFSEQQRSRSRSMSPQFPFTLMSIWTGCGFKHTSSLTRLISIIRRNFKIVLRNRCNFYNLRATLHALHLHTFARYSSFQNILFDEDCMLVYFFVLL